MTTEPSNDQPSHDQPELSWGVTRRWGWTILGVAGGFVVVAVVVLVGFTDASPFPFLLQVALQTTVIVVLGGAGARRERLTVDATGITVVSVNRRSVLWQDVEAFDGNRLRFSVSTERTADTGVKISYDPHVRSLPARRRTVGLRRFLTQERRAELRRVIARYRPDLTD